MALRELRDSALLNVLSNDSSRRDWAAKDSASEVQLPPEPDTWSVVSSTVEAVARGGINLVTRVAERLTSPRPSVLQQPTVPTAPAGSALGPDGPDGDADDELKEVVIMFVSCALWRVISFSVLDQFGNWKQRKGVYWSIFFLFEWFYGH
jgi:hypothetical protein